MNETATPTAEPAVQPPSLGRIVHYVGPDTKHRCARIVATDKEVQSSHDNPFRVNLQIDGHDLSDTVQGWRGAVPWDKDGAPGTWHWPERL